MVKSEKKATSMELSEKKCVYTFGISCVFPSEFYSNNISSFCKIATNEYLQMVFQFIEIFVERGSFIEQLSEMLLFISPLLR